MNEPQKNDQKYTEELEKIEKIRQSWICKKKKDQRWEQEKADIRELVSDLRKQAA